MQSSSSPFVVNIVPLANVNTTTTGLDPTTALSNTVAGIQTIVDVAGRRINADVLSAYTTDASITVISPLNLSNVGFQSNGVPIAVGGGGSVLSNGSTLVLTASPVTTSTPVFSVAVGASPALQVLADGDVVAGGTVYAQGFVTLSDELRKRDIRPLATASTTSLLHSVRPYAFRYGDSGDPEQEDQMEIGLLAQEVEAVFPECVVRGPSGSKYVKYDAVVALLLGAVRELGARVEALERQC